MITYGSTTLTSYNTITKIEVYYYKSTSATSLSGGSWSTTKPTWENGKYIWQKIRTTYEGKLENGQYYSESDPVNITGQQGATGTAAYSYKLNASDTTVTISKIGVYSVNKITFTATSKQGTGNVVPYAGQFKIETTINGTTWTTSYTSSGNESSKEFTIPTGIIAIRCSLYQANGITTLLDIITIPILSDDRPIVTKTYTGLIGSANDAAGASFYFAKIHPDSYTTNYKVKMKVRVTAPEAYAETIDIQFGGYGSTFSSYDAYTTRTGSTGIYYINLYRATQAGISTNHKGHALGVGLRSSTNPTNTSYKRTIIVDILELDGCTIKMLDTAVKYANIDGTGTTNYYGLTEMAVGTTGQNATNNTNTHYTQYSNNVKAGTNGIKGYTLIMKDSENTWSCFYSGAYKVANTGKPVYTGGFILGKILYSAGAGAQTSNSSLDTYYNYKLGVNTSTVYDAYPVDLRYSTNCASALTSQCPVYIVGTIENDGLFHLDVSQWWTQTEPTYADEKVYIYVGMAYSTYQVWLSTENPAYVYYNGEFILYDKAVTLQNIASLKDSLETQIDSKVETWCQKSNPANNWTAEERPNHTGDLWYYIGESGTTYKNNTTYQYNGSTNTWSAYSANPDLFDKIDGKSTIYYGTTSSVTSAEEGDYLVDSENDCTYRWNNGAWVLATDYKQVAIDAIEIGGRNLLKNSKALTDYWKLNQATVSDGVVTVTPTANGDRRMYQMPAGGYWTWTTGQEYTVSVAARSDNGASLIFQANGAGKSSGSIVTDSTWKRYSFTFVASRAVTGSMAFSIVEASGKTIQFKEPKLEYGTKPTDWTPAPEDVDASISTAQSTADTAMDRATAIYGTCSTATGTAAKAVTCPNFVLFDGARIQVTFANANTASAPTLNVNSTGAKPIYINKTITSSSNLLLWTAGSKMEFVYDGTGWIAQNVPYALYGTCSTGASTAAKAVTCNEAVICKGTTISVNMTNTNTAANATLNVGSTVAKDIYANDTKLTVNSRFNWRANTVQKFVFDGQVWRMDDDSVKALATAYITEIDEDGIMIHPEDDNNSGWAISDAIQLFKNGISYIKLWIENNIPKIRLGKEDQGHIILDNDSVDVRNGDDILASFGETMQLGKNNDARLILSSDQFQMLNSGSYSITKLLSENTQDGGYAYCTVYMSPDGVTTIYYTNFTVVNIINCYYEDTGTPLEFPTVDDTDKTKVTFATPPEANRRVVFQFTSSDNLYRITLGSRLNPSHEEYVGEGSRSIAIGNANCAYGAESICVGTRNVSYTNYCFGFGEYLKLGERARAGKANSQTVLGKYNEQVSHYDYSFVIGNGTSDSDRKNAFAITTAGSIEIGLDTTASSGTIDADLYDAITALGWEDDVIK